MRAFFSELTAEDRKGPQSVGRAYGAYLFNSRKRELVDEKKFSLSNFHIGLGSADGDLDRLTKRGVLVAESLLLAHGPSFPQHTVAGLSSRRDVFDPFNQPFRDPDLMYEGS